MKGIIVIYLNRDPMPMVEQEQLMQMLVKHHTEVLKNAKEEGYEMMFVPTEHEASRAEKIDFDKPFPFHPVDRMRKEEKEDEE